MKTGECIRASLTVVKRAAKGTTVGSWPQGVTNTFSYPTKHSGSRRNRSPNPNKPMRIIFFEIRHKIQKGNKLVIS